MFNAILTWFSTPVGKLVGGWLALGVATLLFKSRSAATYAALASRHPVWFFARLAAFWQLLGGLGLDPLKVAEAVTKVVKGTYLEPEVKVLSNYPGAVKVVTEDNQLREESFATPIPSDSSESEIPSATVVTSDPKK